MDSAKSDGGPAKKIHAAKNGAKRVIKKVVAKKGA
jgi:hypothetical protein